MMDSGANTGIDFGRHKACDFIKKVTLAQVLSCEFCQIFKKFFYRTPLVATSALNAWYPLEGRTGT